MKSRLAKLFAISISIVLVALLLLLSQIQIADIITTVADIDSLYLIAGFLLYVCSYLFRALRFHILLNRDVGIRGLFSIVCVHNMMNNLLPARTGELSYMYLLKKVHNRSLEEGIATLTIARILDFITISLIFFSSALLIADVPATLTHVFSGIVACLVLAVLFLFSLVYRREKCICTIESIAENLNLKRFRLTNYLLEKMSKTIDSIAVIRSRRVILSSFLLSFMIWCALYSMIAVVLKGMHLDLSITVIILGSTFSIFTNVLPIPSVGAFGIYEGAWTVAFMSLGVCKECAVISGFGVHIISFMYFVLLGSYGILVMKREA